jgi:hypothetical protein
MRRTRMNSMLATLAISAAGVTASAQQPTTVYTPPQPAATYAAPRTVDSRAVLPAFSRRGGIGTTPFLGNTRGLGGFSVNYDAPPRPSATRPARRVLLFRRFR